MACFKGETNSRSPTGDLMQEQEGQEERLVRPLVYFERDVPDYHHAYRLHVQQMSEAYLSDMTAP